MTEEARRALERAGLGEAVEMLERQGFETLGDIAHLDEALVERLFGDAMLPGHRVRLMRLAEEQGRGAGGWGACRERCAAWPAGAGAATVAVAGLALVVAAGRGRAVLDVLVYLGVLLWYVVRRAVLALTGGRAARREEAKTRAGGAHRRFAHIEQAARDAVDGGDAAPSRVSLEALSPEEKAIFKLQVSKASSVRREG